MLVKWISCEVVDPAGFDRGQRAWSALRSVPGFRGQGGGLGQQGTAQVFGLWDDLPAHQAFMAGQHDALAAAQAGTFGRIQVRMFQRLLDIGAPFTPAGAGLVRLAHCRVRPDRVEHFVAAQQQVWNPGMGQAAGMLGGVFARAGETEFLVLSRWESVAHHRDYVTGSLPGLRERSGVVQDLVEITGAPVELNPHWSVAP